MAPHSPSTSMVVCSNPSCGFAATHVTSNKCVACGKILKRVPMLAGKRKRDLTDDGSAVRMPSASCSRINQTFLTRDKHGKRSKPGHVESDSRAATQAKSPSTLAPAEEQKSKRNEAKPPIAWCFKCHVGSHWSRDCRPERESKESNLAPALGWQDFMLPSERFATVQRKAPKNAVQLMHHLWHSCLEIQECSNRVKYRDEVLQSLVNNPFLLGEIGADPVLDELPERCRDSFELMCARANKACHAFMIEYASQLRSLYQTTVRSVVHPNKDRKAQSALEKRQEMAEIATKIYQKQSKIALDGTYADGFLKKVGDAKAKYDTEMNSLDEEWTTQLSGAEATESTVAPKTMEDLKYLPTRGFRIDMVSQDTWLPVLTSPKLQDRDILSQVYRKGIPEHLLNDAVVATELPEADTKMTGSEEPIPPTPPAQEEPAGRVFEGINEAFHLRTSTGKRFEAELQQALADVEIARKQSRESCKTLQIASKKAGEVKEAAEAAVKVAEAAIKAATEAAEVAENAQNAAHAATEALQQVERVAEQAQSRYNYAYRYEMHRFDELEKKLNKLFVPPQDAEQPAGISQSLRAADSVYKGLQPAVIQCDQEIPHNLQSIDPSNHQLAVSAHEEPKAINSQPLSCHSDEDDLIEWSD